VAGFPSLRSKKLVLEYNIPISKTLKFWEGLKEGKVFATRCKMCGRLYFPPVADCGECYSSDIEWVELRGEGRVISFTHVDVRPPSFRGAPPYTVAIAELDDGVKALAWLVGAEKKDVRIGMRVRLVPRISDDGFPLYVLTPHAADNS